jgi:putative thioredoxin
MSNVHDVSEAEFDTAVLARSREVPVVVDFWAEWCAPCRALGPTIEKEVAALGGRVELKKVDVDHAQSLAGQYKVQSIPAVMAFRDGQVVADFVGARDAGFIRRWLAGLAPSKAQEALSKARGEVELRALLGDAEVGPSASLQLAELLMGQGKAEDAVALLAPIHAGHALGDKAEALRRQAAFSVDAQSLGGEAGARAVLEKQPGNLEAHFALASAMAARGDFGEALEHFLAVVAADRKFRDDGARKAMVTIFDRLGATHELTQQFRRRLQIVL